MTTTTATVEEGRFRGVPALTITAGGVAATFLPGLGMTGVSLRHGEREHLALPGGLAALRSGATLGLPLLAPWANRLAGRRYRAAGVDVDLRLLDLRTDGNGLPIHGVLVGRPGWHVSGRSVRSGTATIRASRVVDDPAFPFPHRIELSASVGEGGLTVRTTVTPTGRRRVPVSFGWHPYLRLPGAARREWRLELPSRSHLELDGMGIPTGRSGREAGESAPIAGRTFDDLYRLGRERRLSVVADDGSSITLRCGKGYPFAQVWVPPGRPFVALEPMTAATNSLVDGGAPLARPGERFTATFGLELGR